MLQPLFNKTNRGYVPLPDSPIPHQFRPTSDKRKENEGKGCHVWGISEDGPVAPEPFFAPRGDRPFFQKKRPSPIPQEPPSVLREQKSKPLPPLSLAKHMLLKSRLLEFNKKVARVMFRTWIVSVLEKKSMGYREWRIYVQCHKALTAHSDINKDTLPPKSVEKFQLMGVEPEDFSHEAWMPGAFEPPTQISKLTFEERKERLLRKLVAAFLVGVEKQAEERERLEEQARLPEQEEGIEEDEAAFSAVEEGDEVAPDAENDVVEGDIDGEARNTDKAIGSDDPIDVTETIDDDAKKPRCLDDSSAVPPSTCREEGTNSHPPSVAIGGSPLFPTSHSRNPSLREVGNLSFSKQADPVQEQFVEEIGAPTIEDAGSVEEGPAATPTATVERVPSPTPPHPISPRIQVKVEPSEQEILLPAQHTQHSVQNTTYVEQGAEHLQATAVRGPPADSFACLAIGMGRAPRDDFEREVYTEGLARAYAQILTRENLEYDFANQGIELPHIEDDDVLKPRMGNVWALEHDAYQTVYANAFAEVLAQEVLEEEAEAEDSDEEDERPVELMDQDWKVHIRRPRRAVLEDVELADVSAMDVSFHGPGDPMECEVVEGCAGMSVSILAGMDDVDDEPMDVDAPHDVGDVDIYDASIISSAPVDVGQPADPEQDVVWAFGNIDLESDDAIEVDTNLDW